MTNLQSTIEDLKLMMTPDHLVISNSTYEWWAAAFVGMQENTMIACPDLWWDKIDVSNINMYPKNWIVIKAGIKKNKSSHYLSL